MPCYSPLDAWPAAPPARGVVFSPRSSYAGAQAIALPCGRCIGCRLARASQWATRIAHEASLYSHNSFLTLTYSDAFLPSDESVSVRELQLFMKRLRKHFEPAKIRFVGCGEYGSVTKRPHYHVILFNQGFAQDRQPWRKSQSGHVLFRSPTLEKLWPYGNSEIGSVTAQSGGYVARYTLKKMFGDNEVSRAAYQRQRVNEETGEVEEWSVAREFFISSRRPGIGAGWFERFKGDAFPSDFVVLDGQKKSVPDFYRRRLQAVDPLMSLSVGHERRLQGRAAAAGPDGGDARLLERLEYRTLVNERFERDPER